jgi:hypothetical protein
MKQNTAKPADRCMKFFTPELYLQFNSTDDQAADRADAAWEAALAAYRQHLADIQPRLPSSVRRLTEMSLHDAELLSLQEITEPSGFPFPTDFFPGPFWLSVAVLSLRQDNQVTTLIYALADHIRHHPALTRWRFSKQRRHWLYDELDLAPQFQPYRAVFLQRILFSDGTALEIPFSSVLMHQYELPVARAANGARRPA